MGAAQCRCAWGPLSEVLILGEHGSTAISVTSGRVPNEDCCKGDDANYEVFAKKCSDPPKIPIPR